MRWLLAESVKAGCHIIPIRIHGNIIHQEAALKAQFGVDAIVNCAGLGSAELVGESMYPLRGALVRVHNDGTHMPRITNAHCVSHDESLERQDIIFIVPRGSDRLVLGGLAEKDQWDVNVNLENHEPIREMVRRCVDFLPLLHHARIDTDDTTRVGLRPFRKQNVRLERETHTQIIHNYGHGGAGVTFSWGCAQEVADTMERLLCS
jgi:D-amino-acid oxidase